MAEYVLKLTVDSSNAIKSIDSVEKKVDEVKAKVENKSAARSTGNAFDNVANSADLLDNLFGKLGGSSAAVADSFKVLRTSLMASGIGAIVVLIGELINNFDLLLSAIDGVNSEQELALENSRNIAATEKQRLDDLNAQDNILKEQGLSERQILELKKAQAEEAIKALESSVLQEETILRSQVAAAQRNKEILKGILDFLTAPLRTVLAGVDAIGIKLGQNFNLIEGFNELTDSIAKGVFDPDQVVADGAKSIEESRRQIEVLKNQRAGYNLAIKAIDKSASDAAIKEAERIRDEEKKILDERKKHWEELDAMKIVRAEETAIKEIELGNRVASGQLAALIERNKKEQEYDEELYKKRLELASGTIGALMALNEAFAGDSEQGAERAFRINKGLALAQAIMDTYKSANAILSDPTYIGPTRFIAAASAIAFGIANVAKIARTKFEPGGGGSAPSASTASTSIGSTTTAPEFNPINNTTLGNRPGQASQTYVLANDVRDGIEANEKIQNLARL